MAAVALEHSPRLEKLRVALFADAGLQPRWVVEAFARVAASDCAEIVLISVQEGGRPRDGELADIRAQVPHKHAPRADLDVAFALGAVDDAALDGIARLGVWRLRVDGAGEVARGEPLTGAALTVRLAAGTRERVAYESWGRTDALSVARNRRAATQKAAQIPLRVLREARRSGRDWLAQCRPAVKRDEGANPSLAEMGRRILAHAVEKAVGVEQWALAFRFGPVTPGLEGFTRIAPPRGRDWTDPCALAHQGRHYVFFADAGRIALTEIAPDGRWSAPRRVLEPATALAHPFLFEHEGRLYLVADRPASRALEAYRCVEFPLRWTLERVLLEGERLTEAVLHRAAERWWLFANGDLEDELHLFHARHPLGDWQPHRRNPVKSDARSSRPAGGLYWREGTLCRPARICAPRPGAGVAIHRVLRLTPGEYAERQLQRLLPPPGLAGMGSVSRAGALTVVDVLTRRSRLA